MDRRRQQMTSLYAQPKLGKSSVQKAKDLLRKAAKDGTLREILWGKDWNNAKKKIAIEAAKLEIKKAATDDLIAVLPPIDDVAVWNRLLAARVMRTVSLLTQQFAIDAATAQQHLLDDDEDDQEYDPNEPDISDEDKLGGEVDANPRPLSRSSSPSHNKRRRNSSKNKENNREKNKEKKRHKKDSKHDEGTNKAADDDVDFFLNILSNKQSKGPRRVSQIIKEAKDRDNAKRKGAILDTMEEEDEDDDYSDGRSSSAASNSPRGGSGGGADESAGGHVRWGGTTSKQHNSTNKANKTLSTLSKQAGIDFGIASLLHPNGNKKKKPTLTQQEKNRRKSKHQAEIASFRSIQVVEGLFAMSNELLMERESILNHSHTSGNNTNNNNDKDKNDAFINRNATLKYNEQLEEVAQSRLDSISFQRKAALIRLRKSTNKFKSIYHSSNLARFASFWETLQEVNERIDEENLRHIGSNGESCYEAYHAPLAKEIDGYSSSNDHNPAVVQTRQGTTSGMGDLESMLEENLGLLFATKTKAGMANNTNMSRLTTANSTTGGRKRGSANGSTRGGGRKQRLDGFDVDGNDFNDDKEDDEDDDSDEDNDRFGGNNQENASIFSQDPLHNHNQRNLSVAIDRMKAMGIYSDDKFRFIYGMTPRGAGGSANGATPMSSSSSQSRLRKGTLSVNNNNTNNANGSPSMMERWLEDEDSNDSSSGKHQFLKKGSRMKLTNSSPAALYQGNNNSRFQMDANIDLLSMDGIATGEAQPSATETEKRKELFLTQRILSFTDAMGEGKLAENDGNNEENVAENINETETAVKKVKRPYLSKQSIRPFDEKDNRPMVDILLSDDHIHLTAMDPTMIVPQMTRDVEGSVANDSNTHGRWQYDETLPILTRPVVIRREEDRVREIHVDLQHQKNLFLHNGFIFPSKKRRAMTYAAHQDIYQELTFDPISRQLILSSLNGDQLVHQQCVDIASVFFTESQVAGMISIRCQPTQDVPSGYLGSFPTEQWLVMEEEMNTAMILHRLQQQKQQQQQQQQQQDNKTVTWQDANNNSNTNEFIAVPRFSSLQGQQAGDVNVSLPGLTLVHPPTTTMKRKGSILTGEGDGHDNFMEYPPLDQMLPSWDDIMRQAAITAKYAQRPSSAPDQGQEAEDEEKVKQEKQAIMIQQEHPEVALMNDHRPLHSMTIRATTSNFNVRGSTSQLPSAAATISLSQSLKVQPLTALPPRQPKSTAASFRTKRMLAATMLEEEAVKAAAAAQQQEQEAAAATEGKPFDFRSLRLAIPTKPESQDDDNNNYQQQEEEPEEARGEINIDNLPFNFNFQIVQLVESRRIMQLYFTKKFLQLDLPVNIHLTIYDAAESLLEAPGLYGIIFVSYLDLIRNGSKAADLQRALQELLPAELDKMRFSVFVYDVSVSAKNEDSKDEDDKSQDSSKDSSSSKDDDSADEILAVLELCGVTDVIHPPYDIATLKNALATHQRKQEFRMQFAAAAAFKFPR